MKKQEHKTQQTFQGAYLKIVCSLVAFLWLLPMSAQEGASLHLTLETAIRKAQDSSIVAFIATHDYATARYAYDYYVSSTGPQVNLSLSPTYYRQTHYASYNYALPSTLDMAGINADVSFEQQITKWGGTVYAESKHVWSQLFGDMANDYGNTLFGMTPLRVGYRQSLLGWNAFKWEREIQSFHNNLAVKQFDYAMQQIAEQAANKYFEYVSSQLYCEIYKQNFLKADTLFRIGQQKFQLTTVTKDELMALDISRSNAENQMKLAEATLDNARLSLLSYLHIEDCGQTLELENATVPKHLVIDAQKAINMARKNNPLALQLDETILAAERDLDEARRRTGLQIGMDVSVGLQNINRNILKAYEPRHQAQAEVTFSIPLYDSGLAKNRVRKTQEALRASQYAHDEQVRQTDEQVLTVINLIRVQQRNIPNAQHNVELADAAFELVSWRYANGLTDINTYQLTLSRKDEAHQIYISLLNDFWTNYYKLSRLTMYDFIRNKEL